MSSEEKIGSLPGIGKKTEEILNKAGVFTVQDLIEYFPRRYEEYMLPVPAGQVKEGKNCVIGTINASILPGNGKTYYTTISDQTGRLTLRWFQNKHVTWMLKQGETYVFIGNVSFYYGNAGMMQPEFMPVGEYLPLIGSFKPIYPSKKGLPNTSIRRFIMEAFESVGEFTEPLPTEVVEKYRLMPRKDALCQMHFPANKESYLAARFRIAFEEFYELIFSVRHMASARGRNIFRINSDYLYHKAIKAFPFSLTGSQTEALAKIVSDLRGDMVSSRLIQGDVGCGKTAVALLAMILCAENGYQAALMAPTEVLATQHYEQAVSLLEKIGVKDMFCPVLLVGSLKEKEKNDIRLRIASGEAKIIIGTHALIQKSVEYQKLALAIIDEQHRFGVKQREEFSVKSPVPIHTIIMTATPIPRTTGKILFGGMDITLMQDKPMDRLPIKSCKATPSMRPMVYRLISNEVAKGHQVYAICPMVEDTDDEKQSVEAYSKELQKIFPGMKIGTLHGKMSAEEKQEQMERFSQGETDILVSTTVVEVGVNVPNATVILIENAHMFGMLQLHQLRGRVGRGKDQSYCVFMAEENEPDEKLDIISRTLDGFEIAEADYRMRQAGDILGVRQSGQMEFKVADIALDKEALVMAEEAVEEIFCKK